MIDKYAEGGRCVVITTSATGAPSPIHEYLYGWGDRPENTFLTMGRPIPGSPMWRAIREYGSRRRAKFKLSIWNGDKGCYEERDAEIVAEISSFDLISAHATHDEIRQLFSSVDSRRYCMVHIGGDKAEEELKEYLKEGSIKAGIKRFIRKGRKTGRPTQIPRTIIVEEVLDGFEVPLRKPKRTLYVPEDVWEWLRKLSERWYGGKPFNEKMAIRVLRRLRSEVARVAGRAANHVG